MTNQQQGEPLIIDAAIGGEWEMIGDAITRAGQEDASGYRRHLVTLLRECDFPTVARALNISEDEAAAMRARLVTAWGDPDNPDKA
jgi:hypothetical protein